ncbi:MAG: Na+/H+ antiporter NhaC family protein [Bacteroidales bacterium]|jgi:NhaC family Na+:H+ antiporter|nr:Na+/H+ antiporter NhaC family protein [Bacteroidales bacterium]MDY6443476.1 Na+/H+ antiporter NhaC family protein [Bacteroidales bacterium]
MQGSITATKRTLIALIPLGVLMALLALDIAIFGADSILGASQVSLLLASGVCVALSVGLYKARWKDFERDIVSNIGEVAPAILILFLIGAISGTWTMSGVVPTFICYGIKLIHPKVFLLTSCVLCAVVSLMIGSSWTTIATVGVALIGIGHAEGFSDAVTAGAIISGAYFGDKISPLSDTTVMASSVNRVGLFDHIHYMYLTTVPSMLITLVIFTILGLTHAGVPDAQMARYSEVLSAQFHITPWLLLVPALTVWLIIRKRPAIVVLALSVLVAALAALIFQPEVVRGIGAEVTDGAPLRLGFAGTVRMIFDTVALDTGSPEVNPLVTGRGMVGMLNTVFLILCAMCFGGCMKSSGMIDDLARILRPLTRTRAGLVGSTVVTGTVLNGIVSDQYLSIILTSDIYRKTFEDEGYEARLLSRSIEDSATVTSPLVPWSSCGMTQATILSVSTLAYAPFCFFNIISPLMSILMAVIGWKIVRRPE